VGGRGQHVVERRAGGREDALDALEHVACLLADVLAELARLRVPTGLARDEDEVAELRRERQVRVGGGRFDLNDLFLRHGVLPNAGADARARWLR
jgi:hypothetical protein